MHPALVAALLTLVACTQPASVRGMRVDAETDAPPPLVALSGLVEVAGVSGGGEPHALWPSDIENTSLRDALQDSLAAAGLAARAGGARVLLSAVLLKVEPADLGAGLSVRTTIAYSMVDRHLHTIWTHEISAAGTASSTVAMDEASRQRLATEAAARENIRQLVLQLRQLRPADVPLATP